MEVMDSNIIVSIIFMMLLIISNVEAQGGSVIDITKLGATTTADISQVLLNAWKQACAAATPTIILIPKATYGLSPVKFIGPCKAAITINHQGIFKAPTKINADGWVSFYHVDKLTLTGGGVFDGQGQAVWKDNGCLKDVTTCKSHSINIRFDYVTNSMVQSVTSLNSKNFHVNVLGCDNLTFQKFTVIAPADSPNTDGIHIARSTRINVLNTNIATGDDCISIGDGAQGVIISNVHCGPGHGIAIGSLGLYEKEQPVTGIHVQGSTFTNTENGVRIKSWAGKFSCIASDIHFQDLTMNNVAVPIIIDQMYCPHGQCNTKAASNVKISGVYIKGITGTTTSPNPIQLVCSSAYPCEKVEIGNINLKYTGAKGPAKTTCTNVKPTVTGPLSPPSC
ncbi:exopolygalacturonase-like [Euphorbia lathyris]|uniref:exopolygalacturonase-like n=1 Tax=Euphorbia lathyris TaxID=212925 RepID=UPI0033140BD6